MSQQAPIAKRRRLNDATTLAATHTLAKPFKSPLKQSPEKCNRGRSLAPDQLISPKDTTTLNGSESVDQDSDNSITVSSGAVVESEHASPTSTKTNNLEYRGRNKETSSSPVRRTTRTPASHMKLKRPFVTPRKCVSDRTLILPLPADASERQLRSDIDSLNQAIRVLSSNRTVELSRLINTWKRVAREAAEEVFAGAKDRVNRMGGVGAWRDIEKQKRERQREWDVQAREAEQAERKEGYLRDALRAEKAAKITEQSDEADAEAGEEDNEEEVEDQAKAIEIARQLEADVIESDDNMSHLGFKDTSGPGGTGNEEDEFTMDMMLNALNIDLSVIGFDSDEKRWVD